MEQAPRIYDRMLAEHLAAHRYSQAATKAPHAFQAVLEMDHVDADCFAERTPVVVPARTLLSQLL